MGGLDPKLVASLYAKRRTRGGYVEILTEAAQSDENGFAAKATYPQLAEKNPATLYQGFRNAAEKMGIAEKVDILNSDDEVYVIFKERVHLVSSNGNGSEPDSEPAADAGK
jgi:hypothetical protein